MDKDDVEGFEGLKFLQKYGHGPGVLTVIPEMTPDQAEEMIRKYNERYPDGQ